MTSLHGFLAFRAGRCNACVERPEMNNAPILFADMLQRWMTGYGSGFVKGALIGLAVAGVMALVRHSNKS
jgi:tetrahydromethanopterin S-methyltransferase subunit A